MKNFLVKSWVNGPVGRKRHQTEGLVSWCFKPSQPQRITSRMQTERGVCRRTRKEIVKWHQMTAQRLQTGGRHQTSLAQGPLSKLSKLNTHAVGANQQNFKTKGTGRLLVTHTCTHTHTHTRVCMLAHTIYQHLNNIPAQKMYMMTSDGAAASSTYYRSKRLLKKTSLLYCMLLN